MTARELLLTDTTSPAGQSMNSMQKHTTGGAELQQLLHLINPPFSQWDLVEKLQLFLKLTAGNQDQTRCGPSCPHPSLDQNMMVASPTVADHAQ